MISVCIPVYNGESFLKKQIDSIIMQLSPDDEIIVSDDVSTDTSLSILREFSDPRICILQNTHRLGPTQNLERALQKAKGEILFLSDQDDEWHPQKVKICTEALQRCDCLLHDATVIDEQGNAIEGSFFQKRKVVRGLWRNWWRNSYTGCCMAFRRNVLNASLPFPPRIPMHDQWIGLVAERSFLVLHLPEPLISYRQHSSNATSTVYGSSHSIWTRVRWRLILLREILVHRSSSRQSL